MLLFWNEAASSSNISLFHIQGLMNSLTTAGKYSLFTPDEVIKCKCLKGIFRNHGILRLSTENQRSNVLMHVFIKSDQMPQWNHFWVNNK